MPAILIRGLKAQTLARLKARAKNNGRSLQGEARTVLEQAAGTDKRDIKAMMEKWKTRWAGRHFSSSVEMIREDRER